MAKGGTQPIGDSLTWGGSATESRKKASYRIHYAAVFLCKDAKAEAHEEEFDFDHGASADRCALEFVRDFNRKGSIVASIDGRDACKVNFQWRQRPKGEMAAFHSFRSTHIPDGAHAFGTIKVLMGLDVTPS